MGASPSNIEVFSQKKKIVIVGSSFAGQWAARGLIGLDPLDQKFEILMIDRSEHFEDVSEHWRTVVDPAHFERTSFKFAECL